jgi:hypothetical protein
MAKLTDEEAGLLKKLMAKREAPDGPGIGRAINVSIDLGDEAQVRRAQKLGLLDAFGDDDDAADDDKPADDDKSPKRRGFFGDE